MLLQLKAKSSDGILGFFYDGSVEKAKEFSFALANTWLDVVYRFSTGNMNVGDGFYTIVPNTWIVIYPALNEEPVDIHLYSKEEFDKNWEVVK